MLGLKCCALDATFVNETVCTIHISGTISDNHTLLIKNFIVTVSAHAASTCLFGDQIYRTFGSETKAKPV